MFAVACVALLWPGLSEGKVSGFRDGLHFYFPQAMWLDQCAERSDYFPQWQAHEALGVSVPGETTSAIFYPLRVVMLLPGLSVAQRMAAFVFVHLLIAAMGMAYACRRWQLRTEASWLSGAAFALSCPVFFQLHNLVFLCSAAWLGFLLGEVGCWLRFNLSSDNDSKCSTDRPRLLVLAGALAMIVLAGDPHTAVNVVLVCVAVLLVSSVRARNIKRFVRMACWLTAAVGIAVGLSAVQSVPTLQWSMRSHRLLGDNQDMPVQVPASKSAIEEIQPPKLLQQILSESSHRLANAIYEFSLSPWHLLTTLWPTAGGDYSAGNSRIFAYLPAEGRMWIPSLSFGVMPLLLLFRKRVRSSASEHNWLLWASVLALLASFGNYSIGWLVRELVEASGASALASKFPADHTTSIYGVLADYVPGYALFRYPAKWSVIAVACFVLAAAVRFNELHSEHLLQRTRVQQLVIWCSGIALVLTIVVRLNGSLANTLRSMVPAVQPDVWLGPPAVDSMWRSILFALLIPLAIVGAIEGIRLRSDQLTSRSERRLPLHALMAWLCLLELFIVATNWISFVDVRNVMPSGPFTPEFVWADPREGSIVRDNRILEDFTNTRLQDIADYQRQFGLGKLALLDHRHNLAALLSIEPERLKRLRSGLSRRDDMSASQPQLDEVLAWLGVEKRLVRERWESGQVDFYWQSIANSRPMCEFFADSETFGTSASDAANVSWQWLKAGRLEIVIDSEVAGQLLVRQFNDGGWQVEPSSELDQGLAIGSDASGLFVEISVPAGRHQLSLVRNPWPLRTGAAISFVTLLSCVAVAFVQLRMASATRSRSK